MSGATLGAVVPPPGYLERIAEICRASDVLLITDEVMSGMGRTGRNFAVDHWNVAPDILVTAKGLSSGYAPLGAVIISKKVVEAIAVQSRAAVEIPALADLRPSGIDPKGSEREEKVDDPDAEILGGRAGELRLDQALVGVEGGRRTGHREGLGVRICCTFGSTTI